MRTLSQVWERGRLENGSKLMMWRGREGSRHVLDINTDLLGQRDKGDITLGRSQHRAAPLQLLLLLHCVGKLETLLILQKIFDCSY